MDMIFLRKAVILRILVSVALALAAQAAAAETYCVQNQADFRNALGYANNNGRIKIEIVQGTYDIHGTVWDGGLAYGVSIGNGTEILGGYTAGCAGRNIEVGNTVIGDSHLGMYVNGAFVYGDMTIEGLTFSIPNGLSLWFDASTMGPARDDAVILFRRDAFLDADYGGLRFMYSQEDDYNGTLRIVDTLVAGNTNEVGSCSLDIWNNAGTPTIQLINDTVVDNHGDGGWGTGACVHGEAPGALLAYNSIFYGNDGTDLFSHLLINQFVDNTIQHEYAQGAIESGTLTGNPRLDADYRPIESPPSPVINSGSTTAPGGLPTTDLPGRNRVIGTAPDRGAFESTINDAFLQTVTNTNDSGAGSLRQALVNAIGHGSGLISFDIGSGCGPHVITLGSELPAITVPLIINGYTQTGSGMNDLDAGDDATFCVILESGSSSVTHGLRVPDTANDGTQLTVNGLAFSGFSDAALLLNGGKQHIVVGSRFGGIANGHTLQPNGVAVQLGTGTSGVTIGGDDVAQRNVIGSSTNAGVVLFGAGSGAPPTPTGTHGNTVINNLIGVGWSTNADAFTNLGNGTRGIYISGYDNTITGNWIGDNVQSGIALVGGGAQGNTINANYIGFPWDAGVYGNGQAGIHLQGDNNDAPTGNTMLDNVIAENGTQGVWVEIGQHNRIRRNGIYANGGLGIDLWSAGVLPNDDDGVQFLDFPNIGLNYPVLSAASGGTLSGTFSGTLTTIPGNYRIDFYQTPGGCDPAGNRQAQGWIASAVVTVPAAQSGDQGTATFSVVNPAGDLGQLYTGAGITATTTDGDGDTSELSACVPYQFIDLIFADSFER
jgi:hypothetical protein